jgi:uncharacterized membrane protein
MNINPGIRPKIKVERTRLDWVIEFVAFVFLIILVSLPLIFFNDLPERVPVHFNIEGEPDDYGTRFSLLLLPVTGLVMYLGMTILEGYPHIYNYPVQITHENALNQYRLATRLIRILKSVILLIFSFITFRTIQTALGEGIGLGKAFLPVFLLVVFGTIIIYFVQSLNKRN